MTDDSLRAWPVHNADFTLPMRYLLRGDGPYTVVLLHGYQDHALSMARRMGWLDREDLPFQVLAVNAPFPVPIWKPTGFIEAYSWYFRDTTRDVMIVHPSDTAAESARLIDQAVGPDTPKVLFGFSQGGILAAFLAEKLKSVRGIVSVGSGFPDEPYARLDRSIRVSAVHGLHDDRWPLEKSKPAHDKLLASGFHGEFQIVPDLGHRVDATIDPLVRRLIADAAGGAA